MQPRQTKNLALVAIIMLAGCASTNTRTGDYENAEISAHERSEYELQGQQEHDRASLMMILTTSRLH